MSGFHPALTTWPPAGTTALDAVSRRLGALPAQLRNLYMRTNGAIGLSGVVLYAVGELVDRNATYEVAAYAPDHLAIGDDGAGRVVLMSRDGHELVLVDAGAMDPKCGLQIQGDVVAWANGGLVIPITESDLPHVVDVFLERAPPGGNRDLLLVTLKEAYDHVIAAMNTPGGVSAEYVDAAEAELGVAFPRAYRRFLAEHGAAVGDGVDLAGLFVRDDPHEPPLWTDVVQATKQVRRISQGGLPESLVWVSDNGGDVKYYLDTRRGGDGVIVALGPGVDGEVVAHSFIEFVVRAMSGDLYG